MGQGCGEGGPDSHKKLIQDQSEQILPLPHPHPSVPRQIRGAQETDVRVEGVTEPKKEVKDGQQDRGAGLAQMGGWVEVVTSLGRQAVKDGEARLAMLTKVNPQLLAVPGQAMWS